MTLAAALLLTLAACAAAAPVAYLRPMEIEMEVETEALAGNSSMTTEELNALSKNTSAYKLDTTLIPYSPPPTPEPLTYKEGFPAAAARAAMLRIIPSPLPRSGVKSLNEMVQEVLADAASNGLYAALYEYVKPGNKITAINTEIVERRLKEAVKNVVAERYSLSVEERKRLVTYNVHISTPMLVKVIGDLREFLSKIVYPKPKPPPTPTPEAPEVVAARKVEQEKKIAVEKETRYFAKFNGKLVPPPPNCDGGPVPTMIPDATAETDDSSVMAELRPSPTVAPGTWGARIMPNPTIAALPPPEWPKASGDVDFDSMNYQLPLIPSPSPTPTPSPTPSPERMRVYAAHLIPKRGYTEEENKAGTVEGNRVVMESEY